MLRMKRLEVIYRRDLWPLPTFTALEIVRVVVATSRSAAGGPFFPAVLAFESREGLNI